MPENMHAQERSRHSLVRENVASAVSKTSLQRHHPLLLAALVWCGPASRDVKKMCLFPRHPSPICRDGAGAETSGNGALRRARGVAPESVRDPQA